MFKYANLSKNGAIYPFEVLAASAKLMEVRALQASKDRSWVAVLNPGQPPPLVLNQESQKWLMWSNEAYPVVKVKKNKAGKWYAAGYGVFEPAEAPVRFYNYNG